MRTRGPRIRQAATLRIEARIDWQVKRAAPI